MPSSLSALPPSLTQQSPQPRLKSLIGRYKSFAIGIAPADVDRAVWFLHNAILRRQRR
jgi:hypothetical protein